MPSRNANPNELRAMLEEGIMAPNSTFDGVNYIIHEDEPAEAPTTTAENAEGAGKEAKKPANK